LWFPTTLVKSWAKLTLKLVSYEVDCECVCILKLSFTFKIFTIWVKEQLDGSDIMHKCLQRKKERKNESAKEIMS
jgi:hypothetical protein